MGSNRRQDEAGQRGCARVGARPRDASSSKSILIVHCAVAESVNKVLQRRRPICQAVGPVYIMTLPPDIVER